MQHILGCLPHPETTLKTNFGNFNPIWMKLGGDLSTTIPSWYSEDGWTNRWVHGRTGRGIRVCPWRRTNIALENTTFSHENKKKLKEIKIFPLNLSTFHLF